MGPGLTHIHASEKSSAGCETESKAVRAYLWRSSPESNIRQTESVRLSWVTDANNTTTPIPARQTPSACNTVWRTEA